MKENIVVLLTELPCSSHFCSYSSFTQNQHHTTEARPEMKHLAQNFEQPTYKASKRHTDNRAAPAGPLQCVWMAVPRVAERTFSAPACETQRGISSLSTKSQTERLPAGCTVHAQPSEDHRTFKRPHMKKHSYFQSVY